MDDETNENNWVQIFTLLVDFVPGPLKKGSEVDEERKRFCYHTVLFFPTLPFLSPSTSGGTWGIVGTTSRVPSVVDPSIYETRSRTEEKKWFPRILWSRHPLASQPLHLPLLPPIVTTTVIVVIVIVIMMIMIIMIIIMIIIITVGYGFTDPRPVYSRV